MANLGSISVARLKRGRAARNQLRINLPARAVGFQGFERRRRGLGERSIVLFDRGERFADSGSEFTGNLTQDIQDIFFSRCLHLLLIEDVSVAAVLGA